MDFRKKIDVCGIYYDIYWKSDFFLKIGEEGEDERCVKFWKSIKEKQKECDRYEIHDEAFEDHICSKCVKNDTYTSLCFRD